jgi:hypothetical protein
MLVRNQVPPAVPLHILVDGLDAAHRQHPLPAAPDVNYTASHAQNTHPTQKRVEQNPKPIKKFTEYTATATIYIKTSRPYNNKPTPKTLTPCNMEQAI